MSKRMLTALLPALAALLAVTAACSSKSNSGNTSSNSSTNGNTNNSSGAIPECPTAATMKSELGLDLKEATVNGTGDVRACMYTPAEGAHGNAIVRFQGKFDTTQFATAKTIFKNSGQPIEDVTGVGDEAYTSTMTAGGIVNNTVIARKGSLEVLIACQAPLDKEKAFANKLLG